ncbi:MAG: reverse transcriptase domain-containing protein [Oscillospiraceae bacterium]
MWNRWIETRKENIHLEYNKVRKKVKEESRRLISQEQNNIAKLSKTNPKKFWQYIKSKSTSSTNIGDLKWVDKNGIERAAETDAEKASALEEFFSSVFTKEGEQDFENLQNKTVKEKMTELVLTKEMILLKLSKLKIDKSPGVDLLHPRVLFECREVLALPLMIIFNKSLSTGCVPDDWKKAEVVALYKKGSRSDRGNYRPVSLTCICCKIQESFIRDHVMNFVLQNKFLSNKQYGFVKGRSTMLQLLHMLDKWTDYLEDGGQIDAIYTDFEKAFDKVPHKRLISKLKSYGINAQLVSWVQNFLLNRKQLIRVNQSGVKSQAVSHKAVSWDLFCLFYI